MNTRSINDRVAIAQSWFCKETQSESGFMRRSSVPKMSGTILSMLLNSQTRAICVTLFAPVTVWRCNIFSVQTTPFQNRVRRYLVRIIGLIRVPELSDTVTDRTTTDERFQAHWHMRDGSRGKHCNAYISLQSGRAGPDGTLSYLASHGRRSFTGHPGGTALAPVDMPFPELSEPPAARPTTTVTAGRALQTSAVQFPCGCRPYTGGEIPDPATPRDQAARVRKGSC